MELWTSFTKSKFAQISLLICKNHFWILLYVLVCALILLVLDHYCFQCVAVDAVVETDLVSALQVTVFPEIIFTKAGKILYREKGNFYQT